MKRYGFSFTDYEVANLYICVDCFLDYLEDYRYKVGNGQLECLHSLRLLLEAPAAKYFGCALADLLPVIFEPQEKEK